MRVVLAAVLMVVAACGGSTPTAPSVPYRVIGFGGGFTPEPPGVRLIEEQPAWAEFIGRFDLRAAPANPGAPLPAVDFSTETAVALFPGQRPTSGYELDIAAVERVGSGLVIRVTERSPCIAATVFTYPLIVVAVPKGLAPIEAAWIVRPCQ